MTCSRYRATRVFSSWTVCRREGEGKPSVCLSVCHHGHKLVSVRVSASVRVRLGSDSSISRLTIRLPCTDPSVLSRRSGPLCATLVGKMIPEVLGRFFRPYGAEHMHAKPPAELSPRQTKLSGGVLGSADAAALTGPEEACSRPDGAPAPPSASQRRGVTFSSSRRQTGALVPLPPVQRANRLTVRGGARIRHTHSHRCLHDFLSNVTSRGVSRILVGWGWGHSHI